MADSVIKEYVAIHAKKLSEVQNELACKREALAILATLGTTKQWIGENFSLGDVSRFSDQDVEKYFVRYQSVLGKRVTGDLADAIIDVGVKATSYVLPIDAADETTKDLKKNDLVMRELSTFTGYLALNAGRLVALAAELFFLAKHVDIEKTKGMLNRNSTTCRTSVVSS